MAELRRRNVFRVAATYAVVAWIIIEAGSVLLPTFGASELAFQIYVIVVAIGFVVALVLAWIYELTPEGVKLEKDVDRSKTITKQASRKMDVVFIVLLVIALGVSVTLNITGMRDSTDPENQLFADGMHDDLLTRLANIGALKVISRTSVMEYRDTTKNLRQIAQELGVGTILEGAVQRVGDSVRISAQLIDASTDEHIWANSYDRQLSAVNLFAIQSEISGPATQRGQSVRDSERNFGGDCERAASNAHRRRTVASCEHSDRQPGRVQPLYTGPGQPLQAAPGYSATGARAVRTGDISGP
jgi:TolB-like protein